MTKEILVNEQSKFGWKIVVYTENIYQTYYKDYFIGKNQDTVFESAFTLNLNNCTQYNKKRD